MNHYQVNIETIEFAFGRDFFYLGVEVGEISTRFAQEVGDNGYLRLTNVRIPRTDMLMKLAIVCFVENHR